MAYKHHEPTAAELEADSPFFPRWPKELRQVAEILKKGGSPPKITVRTLLTWFKSQRRGSFISSWIQDSLDDYRITTEPDFNSVWIGSEIAFVHKTNQPSKKSSLKSIETSAKELNPKTEVATEALAVMISGANEDPSFRIGKLEAANKPVISVAPNHSIEQAISKMLLNGFSQLPVMQGDKDVKGVITWESIGARFALNKAGEEVRHFMAASAQIVSSDQSLFSVIETIAQHQYVLIQANDKKISGIVTSADLSRQFQQSTEPFLLLGEIEQYVRRLIADKFTAEELRKVRDLADSDRTIKNVNDLAMGEYIRLLETPKYWERLGLKIDRVAFIEKLQIVRRIRNEIMHFDPDPLGPDDLTSLRQFASFFRSLVEIGCM